MSSFQDSVFLDPQPTLAARFAQLDIKCIQEKVKRSQNEEKLPNGLKKIVSNADFYKIFMKTSKLMKVAA